MPGEVGESLPSPIPESEWVWCAYPGHFIASANCRMHLNTRVGNWRISTLGDYWPHPIGGDQLRRSEIGWQRFYETAIVEVEGDGEHGDGVVVGDHWIHGYEGENPLPAEIGHMEWCHRVAAGWTPNDEWPDDETVQSDRGGS